MNPYNNDETDITSGKIPQKTSNPRNCDYDNDDISISTMKIHHKSRLTLQHNTVMLVIILWNIAQVMEE